MRGQSEREGEGVLQRAQMSEGKWVSGAQNGRGRAEVAGDRAVVGASTARRS
jgi:hypothetical protein